MALTFAVTKRGVRGNQRYTNFTVQFDSSYPTGGEAIAAGDYITLMGHGATVSTIDRMYLEAFTGGQYGALDRANNKLLLFLVGGEAGAASDQSAVTLSGTVTYGTLS